MLPAPLTSFVGRAPERATVAAAVIEQRLVTLVGPGGSGKSRLAVETARDGTHPLLGFVELSPTGTDMSLPPAVLAACGVRDDPGVAPGDRLVDDLQDRTGLLVLDNCEHVHTGVAALLHHLLPRCPDLHVLATSRVALGLVGEAVVPLAGMTADDAATLFVDRARLVQPGLGEPERGTVAEICRLADGLPLAVELAAARARALSVPAIRDGMADRLRFLATRDPRAASPYRSLRASLDRSAELAGAAAGRPWPRCRPSTAASPSTSRSPSPAGTGTPSRRWSSTPWCSSTRRTAGTCCWTRSATTPPRTWSRRALPSGHTAA